MGQPTSRDIHIDVPLTNISIAYMQQETNFVASKVFPVIPVSNQSNKYYKYGKDEWRTNQVKPRAPGSESAGSGFTVTNDNYYADVYAFHKDIADQDRKNADNQIDLDNAASRFVAQQFLIHREVKWASDYFTSSVWGTDKVGNTDFDYWTSGSSDPEKDVDDGKATILLNTGYNANTLVVGYKVHQALKRHPLVLERYKYTSSDSITEDMLARYLEIDRYLVARSSYNTANEGGTASNAFIAGNHALLCHVASAPSLVTPTAGYTFVWSGLTPINAEGVAISNYRMDLKKSDRIEGEFAYDNKVVCSDLGYFFSGAIA
jgi:hypothetical protein